MHIAAEVGMAAKLKRVKTIANGLCRSLVVIRYDAEKNGNAELHRYSSDVYDRAMLLHATAVEVEVTLAETDRAREAMRSERARLLRDISRLAKRVADGKAKYPNDNEKRELDQSERQALEMVGYGQNADEEYYMDEFERLGLVDNYHRLQTAQARRAELEREMLEAF